MLPSDCKTQVFRQLHFIDEKAAMALERVHRFCHLIYGTKNFAAAETKATSVLLEVATKPHAG